MGSDFCRFILQLSESQVTKKGVNALDVRVEGVVGRLKGRWVSSIV